jgi:L-erythro-3,5-diaminohexanoate dehydrogenase
MWVPWDDFAMIAGVDGVATLEIAALGVHRVISPAGVLPQAAWKLDADPDRRHPEEIHIEVESLNIDSASMRQLEEEQGGDPARVGARIAEIVRERGKMQNPVTGSGGMLIGRVGWIGTGSGAAALAARAGVSPGDRVATLVSLTLTPLHLRRVVRVDLARHQVDVEGTAVVFASGALAPLARYRLPDRLALAVLDVAGAAPQTLRLAGPGDRVLILGAAGKSGLLCAAAARRRVGAQGVVVGVEAPPKNEASRAGLEAARRLGYFSVLVESDATDAVAMAAAVTPHAAGRQRTAGGAGVGSDLGYDLVISCVNVEHAEMAAILAARPRGRVYFFSMATSFARAALGAEGISKDVDLLIGNGYCDGHAEATFQLLADEPALRDELARRFV